MPELHPGDVFADTLRFPAGNRGNQHRQVRLAAGGRKSGSDVILSSLRSREARDQHMLRHPAFALAYGGGDPERQTFLAQDSIAAVTGTVGPDQVLLRKVADVFLL